MICEILSVFIDYFLNLGFYYIFIPFFQIFIWFNALPSYFLDFLDQLLNDFFKSFWLNIWIF
jgi:hypothetical protein